MKPVDLGCGSLRSAVNSPPRATAAGTTSSVARSRTRCGPNWIDKALTCATLAINEA